MVYRADMCSKKTLVNDKNQTIRIVYKTSTSNVQPVHVLPVVTYTSSWKLFDILDLFNNQNNS